MKTEHHCQQGSTLSSTTKTVEWCLFKVLCCCVLFSFLLNIGEMQSSFHNYTTFVFPITVNPSLLYFLTLLLEDLIISFLFCISKILLLSLEDSILCPFPMPTTTLCLKCPSAVCHCPHTILLLLCTVSFPFTFGLHFLRSRRQRQLTTNLNYPTISVF